MKVQTKKTGIKRVVLGASAGLFALAALVASYSQNQANAATIYTTIPLTQQELTDNWTVNQGTPSGGYQSVSYAGRNDVLALSVDSDQRSQLGNYYWTEGLRRALPDSTAIKADLYIDAAWNDRNVRAGVWGEGQAANGGRYATPMIEYTNAESSGYDGWRIWDGSTNMWTYAPEIPAVVGTWNTLEIVFSSDPVTEFSYFINGQYAGTVSGGSSEKIGAISLNNFNFGSNNPDYTSYWSVPAYGQFVAEPTTKDDCKDGGWMNFGFANQGLCIRYVNTGKDSR